MGIFNRRSILYHRTDTHGYHYAYCSEDISDIRGIWSGFTGGGYEPIADFAKTGATVPLPGFGYSLAKGAMEGAREGFLGAITGPLEATAAGIGVALAFGYIVALIFNPKSPKR